MKNIIRIAFLLPLFAVAIAFTTNAQNNNCNEGRALGAAHSDANFQQCINGWEAGNFWDLTVQSVAVGTNPCTYEVTAYICPACQPNQPCPRIACFLIATALIDENFNVVSVTCNQ